MREVIGSTDASPPPGGRFTVDEVADITGTTVRTIRWYQSEGLLPSPARDGRVAVYGNEHIGRLESIRDLQAHGLTLTAIRRLIDRAAGSAATTALAFVKAAVAQTAEPDVQVITAFEGAEMLGIDPHDVDSALVETLGLAQVLDDGHWKITAPAAFEASAELAKAGVPLERRVEIGRVLQLHTQAMAQAIVELFVDHLWQPETIDAGDPATWTALTGAVERLRPLAVTSVASLFGAALAKESELATEAVLANSKSPDQSRPTAADDGSRPPTGGTATRS